jgi:hypothetical protein
MKPHQTDFLAAGQTMSVGELRAALEGRHDHERVNVFVVIDNEAVALEDLTKVTHHQSIFEDRDEYRSVCLHLRGMNIMRLVESRRTPGCPIHKREDDTTGK